MAEFCGQAWDDFASKLQREYGQNKSRESELTFLFSGLTKWLEMKSLIYWHIKSFEEYIREDLNPLGLRVQIFPSFENINSTFKTTWESNLKSCSTNKMSLLIDEHQKRLIEIDTNIEKIYSQIKLLQTHSSFQELNEKLKIHIEIFNKSILSKKENNFLRDKQDFQEGRAYKWQQKTSGGGLRSGHSIQGSRICRTPPLCRIMLLIFPPNSLNALDDQRDVVMVITFPTKTMPKRPPKHNSHTPSYSAVGALVPTLNEMAGSGAPSAIRATTSSLFVTP